MKIENLLNFLSKSIFIASGNLLKGGKYNLKGKFDALTHKKGFWILKKSKTHVNSLNPQMSSYRRKNVERKKQIEKLLLLGKIKRIGELLIFQQNHFFTYSPTTTAELLTGGFLRARREWKLLNSKENLESLEKKKFELTQFYSLDNNFLKMLQRYFNIKKFPNFISQMEEGISKNTEGYSFIKARIGQSQFRDKLLDKYHYKCPITKITEKSLLFAGHIKPWKDCTDKEKLDIGNGVLLSPLFNCLFDQGLITFNDDGEIRYSSQLSDQTIYKIEERIKNNNYAKEIITNIDDQYLKWHRKKVFKIK